MASCVWSIDCGSSRTTANSRKNPLYDLISGVKTFQTTLCSTASRGFIHCENGSEESWRFWGLYVHVCKLETLRHAYALAKRNNGAPGIDGVTFEAIEREGTERFLEQLRHELVSGTYRPMRNREKEIPRGGGKVRTLGIPTIRDRVVREH